ncbi:MAG: hypothetical protein GX984_06725 [Erysipelothrix sp.]|nr:hypothetical protein [Erysipelothrix sp.]
MVSRVREKKVTIDLVENPIPIRYEEVPQYTKEDYEERIRNVYNFSDERGYSHVIVYGDREHFSNVHYLTGIDPRFEEVLLILEKGKTPKFILGNECYAYANKIDFDIETILYNSFSLVGQPDYDTKTLLDIFKDAGINENSKIGLVGWKYYDRSKHTLENSILDVPNYIVETLCQIVKRENIDNATDIFIDNDYGLRNTLTAKEIINHELNGTKAGRNVYNVIKNLKEGMTEIEASGFLNIDGEPACVYPMVNFGETNTSYGIASPTYHKKLKLGDSICIGMAYRGSLVHKAGVYINKPEDLTEEQRKIRKDFYHTYFASIVAYYENFKIGNTCGDIYDKVDRVLGDGEPGGIKKFGIALNPGHLIHTDEWPNTPFNKDSKTVIRSGMGVQCDYTATHEDPYLTVHVEDGFVVADEKLRKEIKELSPSCYERIKARQKFMREVLNIDLPEEVLPLSDLPGVCFPYMADVSTVLCMD